MRSRYLIAADYAAIDGSGKATIVGEFDRLLAPAYPSMISFRVIFRLEMNPGESGLAHAIQIRFVDEDANLLAEAVLEGEVPRPLVPGQKPSMVFVIEFTDTVIPKEGTYSIELLSNGFSLDSKPIYAMIIGQPT